MRLCCQNLQLGTGQNCSVHPYHPCHPFQVFRAYLLHLGDPEALEDPEDPEDQVVLERELSRNLHIHTTVAEVQMMFGRRKETKQLLRRARQAKFLNQLVLHSSGCLDVQEHRRH